MSAHSFRKFHFTNPDHIGENKVRYLQGKAGSVYYQPVYKREYVGPYIESYGNLRVFSTAESEIQSLKARIKEMEGYIVTIAQIEELIKRGIEEVMMLRDFKERSKEEDK